jgi:hypothetical protein
VSKLQAAASCRTPKTSSQLQIGGTEAACRYFFFEEDFLRGTLAPARRAWDNPMAIACFRLLTFLPDRPLFRVPFFRSRIAFSTFSDAFLLYFAIMTSSESFRRSEDVDASIVPVRFSDRTPVASASTQPLI